MHHLWYKDYWIHVIRNHNRLYWHLQQFPFPQKTITPNVNSLLQDQNHVTRLVVSTMSKTASRRHFFHHDTPQQSNPIRSEPTGSNHRFAKDPCNSFLQFEVQSKHHRLSPIVLAGMICKVLHHLWAQTAWNSGSLRYYNQVLRRGGKSLRRWNHSAEL